MVQHMKLDSATLFILYILFMCTGCCGCAVIMTILYT